MRSQMLTLDAAIAALFMVVAAHAASLALFKATEIISHDILYRRIEALAQHALDVLLFGNGDWACGVGNVRIPGCVRTGIGNYHNYFFPTNYDIQCYVDDSDIANVMGCHALPSNPSISYSIKFTVCVTSSSNPSECQLRAVTLTVWK